MKKILFIYILLWLYNVGGASAQTLKGLVLEKNALGEETPLVSATVFWLGTQIGTTTNIQGAFEIEMPAQERHLVVSYVGYQSDTVLVSSSNNSEIKIILQSVKELETVVIEDEAIDLDAIQSELLDLRDLRKAACCNLSESFETNPTVDVSTSDAVTGTKRIRLLGLDGIYAQIMMENIPSVRGLASRNGFTFIPGTWMKSVSINKGTGSVANGYESITGQINVELAKPENSEKLLINGYVNANGRVEANLNTAHKIADRWSTALLLHTSNLSNAVDRNEDGFVDIPKYTQVNLLNRWKYEGDYQIVQFGVKVLYDDQLGGQDNFERGQERNLGLAYGYNTRVKRLEAFSKIGLISKQNSLSSVGIILSGVHHHQDGFWGLTNYEATQNTFNLNAIFQTEFNPRHKLRAGLSYLLDHYDETYEGSQRIERNRQESVPGIFTEYTWKPSASLAFIAGLRSDFHNLFGTFVTPRLHARYAFTDNTILRASVGRGLRVANPIVENISFLISNRNLRIADDLEPEIAWNFGGSITHQWKINEHQATLVLDFYRTSFENQIVVDLDNDAQTLAFYNLSGRAYANSFQVSLEYELVKDFDIQMAYKYYDIKSTFGESLLEAPFVPKNRFFINLAYATRFDKWQFDFTTHWVGVQRIPNTSENPDDFQMATRSPDYFLFNAQVTKRYKKWEVYIGGENLGNFRQANPIIQAENPYGAHFDAGLVYAPIMGRVIYAGFRFTIKE